MPALRAEHHAQTADAQNARFHVRSLLGRGAQGSVHLADDIALDRKVALKRITHTALSDSLLGEARAVAGLSHPNIVRLYDTFRDAEHEVLVYEYIAGKSLARKLKDQAGPLPVGEALAIAQALLTGLTHAHANGVLHCDIKPANVLIDAQGAPKLTDFGIAASAKQTAVSGDYRGTPAYVAPELGAGGKASPASDQFSVGIVLFEMLTGRPPIVSNNTFETIYRMANEAFVAPSAINPQVDVRLDALVLRALAKRPEERFADVDSFRKAIEEYLGASNKVTEGAGSSAATIEFIMQRMRTRGDFPALGEAISKINRLAASDIESVNGLTAAILKDVSLTNKLLRMVNTAHYQRFGGSVSTVSRAVSLLGFDAVRNCALSLIFFEHLKNGDQAQEMKRLVAQSYFSSQVARNLGLRLLPGQVEQTGIAAMFFQLGKMLVTFYLFEEAQQITRAAAGMEGDEDKAAKQVLDVSYRQVGTEVARRWGFPADLIGGMQPVSAGSTSSSANPLSAIAHCASTLAACQSASEVDAATRRFARVLGLSAESLLQIRTATLEACTSEATALGISAGLILGAQAPSATSPTRLATPLPGANSASTSATSTPTPTAPAGSSSETATATSSAGAEVAQAEVLKILLEGIHDVSKTLATDFKLMQVLRIVLETLYRAGRFQRVVLFTRDGSANAMRVRMAFGFQSEALVSSGFTLKMQSATDLFFGCCKRNADVHILDSAAPKVAPLLPAGFHEKLKSQSMILLPLVRNGDWLGLIYADTLDRKTGDIPREEMDLLKTLRSQAVVAIKTASAD
jgi:eukaryotic-like serine/threonine-protein kinase